MRTGEIGVGTDDTDSERSGRRAGVVTAFPTALSAETLTADVLTADGEIVTVRPAMGSDRRALAALYGEASAESLRLRFFTQPGSASITTEVDRLCQPESDRRLAVVAEEAGALVGVASCDRTIDLDRRAEFSVFVAEHQRERGIGTLLLEHLGARARAHGITELVGEVLPGNAKMLRVARDLRAHAWSRFDNGVLDVGVGTDVQDDNSQLAADVRERSAERASLRAVLSPTSVAVVGAGRTHGGVGHETLRALRDYGFTGHLYAVNRTGRAVGGIPGFRSVGELPAPVDLLVIAVPADQVADVLVQAGAAGVRGAVILSSGFGEDGAPGRRRQRKILELARAHGIRLIGPNCLGVINTDPQVRLNASFAPSAPSRGGLAVASQSGAVAIAILDNAIRTGCGISSFVSLGNKADVSGNDLIAYWHDDPSTHAVALYLESFGNPRKFARTVRALSRRKPVIAIKSCRSVAVGEAAASPTAAAAARAATMDALFDQAGVVRVENLGELLDAVRLLTDQPLPNGDRLAVVGNVGGLNALAADAAEAHGLQVPSLSPAVRQRLSELVPGSASTDNPVDLGAGVSPAAFAAAAAVVAESGEADALLLVIIGTRANAPSAIIADLGRVVDSHPDLTAAAVLVGDTDDTATLGTRAAPIFTLPERAVVALAHASAYAAWRRRPPGRLPDLSAVNSESARQIAETALADGAGWQTSERTAAILAAYGVPVLATTTVTDESAAVAAAEAAGYPVVLKSADPELMHKNDTGGVALGLADADAVRAAFRSVISAGRPGADALVQRQITAPVELTARVTHDPLFGSIVMLGLGGVQTDLLGDHALRLVPMTDLDADRMWRSLRAAPLLTGFRGADPVDTAALDDLLLRLGRLAEELPEVAELDLNPVLAGPDGVIAVDARLRLAPVGAEPDPTLRRLRPADPS
jgi:acyl-CoA synthetase (NDP forming)/L-amino acid N-acyltransferase YncA